MTRQDDPMPPERNLLVRTTQRVLQCRNGRRTIVTAVFLLGTALSLLVFVNGRRQAQHEVDTVFRADAARYYSALRHEVDETVSSGASVADFFDTLGSVDRRRFREFVIPHLKRAHCVNAIVWAPRIRDEDRDDFEAVGRRELRPRFAILDNPGVDRRAERRAEYFPAYYQATTTETDDNRILGWDLGAAPGHQDALERARDTGQPSMTAKVKIATEMNGVVVYWPIYRKDAIRRSVEERRVSLRGYIAIVFEFDRLMKYVLGPAPPADIAVSLSDVGAPGNQLLYVRSPSAQRLPVSWFGDQPSGGQVRSAVQSTMGLDVGGRRWSVTFTPTAGYVKARIGLDMWEYLLLGLATTAFVGGCLLLLMRRTEQVEQLVASRTQELRQAHDRLLSEVAERTRAEAVARRLNQEALTIQEEERRRLSRELHDEAGQSLTGLAITLKLLATDIPQEQSWLRQRLQGAEALAHATAERMRLLARGLRPPALDALGLSASLRGLCHETQRRTGVPIEYRGTEVAPPPDAVSICLYRVLQEALTNVVKHAQAARIEVVLQEDAEAVILSVTDDGKGIDTWASPARQQPSGGIGLVGMRERLENLGGRLEIRSRREGGTCLIGWVPVTEEESLATASSAGKTSA